MFTYFWEFIIILMETILFVSLMSQKLKEKDCPHTFMLQSVCLFLMSGMLFALNQFHFSTLFTVVFVLVLHYIYVTIFFSSSNANKLFWTTLYSVFALIADSLTVLIPVKLFSFNIEAILLHGELRVPYTLVYISILTILILIALFFGNTNFKLSIYEQIVFFFITFMSIIIEQIVLIVLIRSCTEESSQSPTLLLLIFFLVFFLFLSMIFFVYLLGKEKEKNEKLLEENIVGRLERKQLEQVMSSVNDLRVLKHDMKHHIQTLQSLLYHEKYNTAADYIKKFSSEVNKIHYTVSSGNPAIDSIVTNKLALADSYKIRTQHTIHLPDTFPLNDVETCSLIGNLFDNAVESCMKIAEVENRFISFHIKPFQNMLIIQMTNSSDGIYNIDKKGQLRTTKFLQKRDAFAEHGIGLNRIKNITEQHHGFLEIHPENKTFFISILLPLSC